MRRTLSVIAVVGLAMLAGQTVYSSPAVAQASCMHCNFARAKCNRINPEKQDKCKAEQAACIKKCESANQGAAGTEKTKAEDPAKTKK